MREASNEMLAARVDRLERRLEEMHAEEVCARRLFKSALNLAAEGILVPGHPDRDEQLAS